MERFCPICNLTLREDDTGFFSDYTCDSANNHHFSERVVGNDRTIMKVRINPGKHRMYLKINYSKNTTEVWEGVEGQRIHIGQTIAPDFSNLEALESKLRTYVVFS